jgi:flavin reductase (DIM6/NTAB) family NADH-FMN oxidoreductase RutF
MQRVASAPGSCYFYYPRLAAIVGVRDEASGRANFAPVTWASPLSSKPPLYGVCLTPSTHTHSLVLASGEFTVNFLPASHAALAADLGRLSGREVDKVEALGLDLQAGEALATPCLAAAYVAVECLLVDRHLLGDQTLLVGEVQLIHAAPEAFDGDGVLRLEKVQPLLYLGCNHYATADASTVVTPRRRQD